jgi:hypothetical protein
LLAKMLLRLPRRHGNLTMSRPAEIRTLLGLDKSLADTCLGMLRYGLVQRVGRGKYVAAEPSRNAL